MSETNPPNDPLLQRPTGRRDFLRWAGTGAVVAVVAACDERTRTITEIQTDTIIQRDTVVVSPPDPPPAPAVTFDFQNEVDVLNYAYALEQLEAAFFTMVLANATEGDLNLSPRELRVLTDLRDHEVIHRTLFEAALGGGAITGLEVDFSAINFGNRASVLTAARNFEDLGVGAYNGAGQFLQTPAFLALAGKIVSNEARHASAVRDLINPRGRDFAPRAFDDALPPEVVVNTAAPFIRNPITIQGTEGFVSLRR